MKKAIVMHYPCNTVQDLPKFKQINLAEQLNRVLARIERARQATETIVSQTFDTPDGAIRALELLQNDIDKEFSPISHLSGVANTDEVRDVYQQALEALTDYGNWVGQHQPLFKLYQQLDQDLLSAADKQAVENQLLSFRLSGIDLNEDDQQALADINKKLSKLSTDFSNQLLDATDAWYFDIDEEEKLSGLPPMAIAAAKAAAKSQNAEASYRVTLDMPSYLAIMTYADDIELRERVYTAYATRASDQGPHAGERDNGPLINEIRALRHNKAILLGFANYAELSLAKKMAETTDQVIDFLLQLAENSTEQAKHEIDELESFAGRTLNPWDIAYYSEKLKQQAYSVSDEQLRPYFPATKVIEGMFSVCETLFGISIKEASADTWHDDVTFYEIFMGEVAVAAFYFDLYARPQKRGGAWMADCRGRMQVIEGIQQPVAYLTCNFPAPTDDAPSLLNFNEVTTLFHEFGHGLHHMLTTQTVNDVSGINGVPWDAVELPSQFLENWCWQPEVVAKISSHYQSNEPLPAELLDAALKAKNFQSAMHMVRQLEFALFDFRLHLEYNPERPVSVQETIEQVRDKVAVVKPPKWHRFANGFSHIFAGGYAAGYYSYKWAEVLSADAFEAFEEEGIFNKATGQRFLSEILQQGGSRPAMASFKAFRGREPKVDALLRHSGLVEETV